MEQVETVCGALSLLQYAGLEEARIANVPLGDLFTKQQYRQIIYDRLLENCSGDEGEATARLDKLQAAIINNGLEKVQVLDTSWQHGGAYQTMYATTVQLPDGSLYVAYRGTGNGNWKYNADSAFGPEASDMQEWAAGYFDYVMEQYGDGAGEVYVTGHSQGGNNAMYTLLFAEHAASPMQGAYLAFDVDIDEARCIEAAAPNGKNPMDPAMARELLNRTLTLCGVLGMGGMCTRGFGRVRFLGEI